MFSQFLIDYIYEDFILLLMIIGLWIILIPESPAIKRDRDFLRNMSLLVLAMSIFSYIEIVLGKLSYPTTAHIAVSWICYCFKPCLILAPLNLEYRETLKYKLMWLLPLLNCLIYATAFFSPIAFTYDVNNNFIRGPLGFSVQIISLICMVLFVYYSWGTFGDSKEESHYILVFIGAACMTAMVVETVLSRYCISETAIICCYAYYLYLHMHYANEAFKKQNEMLRNQRDALMISQIQPHFMYNTLNIIYYLCRVNPKLAGETVVKFSDYLRNNLDMSTKPDKLIPFTQELKHTQTYADIEMLRFDNISVEYNIEEEDFKIPALSIQPMVENAIKHGVRGKEHGVVIVSTFRSWNDYVITIKDNGIGYVKNEVRMDNREHIGIKNVKERIEKICGGTFNIEMVRDVGTTVTITIPKNVTVM